MSLMHFLSGLANGAQDAAMQQELPPDDSQQIQVIANRPPPIVEAGRPQVVQPEYRNRIPERDPAAVDPNNPAFLDRRYMDWQAQEAQRAAAARAAGGEYKQQEQSANPKDFKAKPGLQFGTHGLARDIIGNVTDFVGSLIGRKPTYRKEKFMDAIYGWDQPGQYEAAMSRGMKYDPELTQNFMKTYESVHGNDEANKSLAGQREETALQKRRDSLGASATGIFSAEDPEAAYSQGGREELQYKLDALYPEGKAPQLPENYEPNTIKRFMYAGWRGTEVQRQSAATMREMGQDRRQGNDINYKTARDRDKNATTLTAAQIRAQAQRYSADRSASSKPDPQDKMVKTGKSQDILGLSETYYQMPQGAFSQGTRGSKNGRPGTLYKGRFYPDPPTQ